MIFDVICFVRKHEQSEIDAGVREVPRVAGQEPENAGRLRETVAGAGRESQLRSPGADRTLLQEIGGERESIGPG